MNGSAHILIVDDNINNRELLAAILQAEGYATSEASDGVEALELLKKTKVDGIVSDILMPNMDGYRFCYEVRKSREHSTVPLVFLTATYTSPSDEKHALDLGADKVLTIPLSARETLKAVREMLSNPLYQKPRAITQIMEVEVIKQYTNGLVTKLEEKIIELHNRTQELKKLSSALEQTADSVIITDKKGVIEYVNPAFETTTGYKKELVLGKTPAFLKSGKHDASFYKRLWKTILSGKAFREDFVNRKSNGGLTYEQQTISPVLDNEGNVAHFVSTGKDVTRRKRVEDRLRRTHEQLRHLLEHSPAVIYTLKIDGERVAPHAVSENILRLLGFTVAELTSFKWWVDHVHPEDREQTLAGIPQTIQRGSLCSEYRIRHKDLHYLWVEDNRRLVCDPEGKPSEIVGVLTDITGRKKAEVKLQESVEQFRMIAENVADLIAVLDVNGKRLYSSPSYKNSLGNPDDLLGSDSFEDIHPDDRERMKRVFSETVRTGIGQRAEFRFLKKNGTVSHIESLGSAIRDEHGMVSKVLVVSRDVTEKKKLEAQFLRSQRMESIGTLAGGIAHDLNNVLSPIVMGIEMLKSRVTDEASHRLLRILETSAQRGSGMIKQVLAFARGVSGEHVLLQARHIILEIQKIVRETFPKSIRFGTEVPRGLWSFSADATQIHQVLLNLCVNARDAMPTGGALTITAENIEVVAENSAKAVDENLAQTRPGAYVVLTVADTGTGIPTDLLDKIFDPFFTTKELGKGTGLGLASVQNIVKSHGGFIDVSSEVGRGTKFRIYFPAETACEENQANGERAEASIGHGELILVVDDEASIRDICRATLETYGYNVLTSADGTEAIVQYTQRMNEVRLVFTDMMMPFMDGRSTIQALYKINPDVKIVATSGFMEEEKAIEHRDLPICDFLAKPYTVAQLLTTISGALSQ